jgi:hypothetical protein
VAVEHDAQDVAGIDDGGSHESWPALGHSLELRPSQRHQPFQRRLHVVDVPVRKRAARLGREARRGESPVDDAQLMFVVADAKLDVAGPAPCCFAAEVRLDTQEVGVPAGRRRQVVGPQVDGAESTQRVTSFRGGLLVEPYATVL